MKNLTVALAALFLLTSCALQNSMVSGGKQSYKNERVEILSNGLKVFFIQDESLPKIDIQLLIPVGVAQQPGGLEGLSSLTARLLDKGTVNLKALEISDLLSDSGTDFDASAGHDFTMLSTQALSTEFEKVLQLTGQILTTAQFPSDEMEREKKLMMVQLQSRKDRSGTWADTILTKTFYDGHYYSQDLLGTEGSLKKITQKNIQDFYARYYQPEGSRLAVSGKLTPQIESQIKATFSSWKNSVPYMKAQVAFQLKKGRPLEAKIATPHKAQTEIRLIQPGISRSNPDFLPLRVANEILGGSFGSRLNQHIRDDLGLTYSIYSYLDTRDQGGSWVISTFSKNETATKTVEETRSVIQKFAAEGIQPEELAAAKNLVKAQLPRALETSEKLGYNLLVLDFYGVGTNYLINFNKQIDKMTVGDVNTVIRKYMKPDQAETFIFAN